MMPPLDASPLGRFQGPAAGPILPPQALTGQLASAANGAAGAHGGTAVVLRHTPIGDVRRRQAGVWS